MVWLQCHTTGKWRIGYSEHKTSWSCVVRQEWPVTPWGFYRLIVLTLIYGSWPLSGDNHNEWLRGKVRSSLPLSTTDWQTLNDNSVTWKKKKITQQCKKKKRKHLSPPTSHYTHLYTVFSLLVCSAVPAGCWTVNKWEFCSLILKGAEQRCSCREGRVLLVLFTLDSLGSTPRSRV